MPFIIIFNIIVLVIIVLDLVFILLSKYFFPKKKGEGQQQFKDRINRYNFYAYIVFFAVLLLMILVNLIF